MEIIRLLLIHLLLGAVMLGGFFCCLAARWALGQLWSHPARAPLAGAYS